MPLIKCWKKSSVPEGTWILSLTCFYSLLPLQPPLFVANHLDVSPLPLYFPSLILLSFHPHFLKKKKRNDNHLAAPSLVPLFFWYKHSGINRVKSEKMRRSNGVVQRWVTVHDFNLFLWINVSVVFSSLPFTSALCGVKKKKKINLGSLHTSCEVPSQSCLRLPKPVSCSLIIYLSTSLHDYPSEPVV